MRIHWAMMQRHIDAFQAAALQLPDCRSAVELIGEKWAFLILRGAFNGLQHFEEFQAGLGIARNILSDRLASWSPAASSSARPIPATGARSSIR